MTEKDPDVWKDLLDETNLNGIGRKEEGRPGRPGM